MSEVNLAVVALADLPEPADPVWDRWLSRAERDYCAGRQRELEHLGGRVAAKRAVLGVLGLVDDDPRREQRWWGQVHVVTGAGGAPGVLLVGDVQRWVRREGMAPPGVSITHAAGYAAAVGWERGRLGVASPSTGTPAPGAP